MKKRIALLSILPVFVMLLASCSGLLKVAPAPMTAGQLAGYVSLRMASVKSYRIDVEMPYSAYVEGHRVTGEVTGIMIEDQSDKKDYYSYVEMNARVSVMDTSTQVKSVEAYHDGTAFSYYSEGSNWRKLCSPMTAEKYRAYKQGDSVVDIDLFDCENKEFTKTEQGYTLTLSGYSEKALESFTESSGLDADVFEKSLGDMIITMEVDKDYLPITVSFELDFGEDRTAPQMSMTMTYSQIDAVERITKTIKPDRFTEVEDLGVLWEIEDMIEDRLEAESVSFRTSTTQKVTVLTQSSTQSASSEGSFGNDKKKGFTYEVDCETVNGATSKFTYADGKQVEQANGKEYKKDMTEAEAKAFIKETINDPSVGYKSGLVESIEKTDKGYKFTMASSSSSFAGQIITQSGASYKSSSHTVEVVIKDGKIASIISKFEANGQMQVGYGQKATLTYKGDWRVNFDD